MRLKEFQGKKYFKEYGLKVPKGFVVKRNDQLPKIDSDVIVKAQTLTGSRKKSGLIKISKKQELENTVNDLFGQNGFKEVLVEEIVNIKKEYYASVLIDTNTKEIICLFSERGGIDIEQVEKKDIKRFKIQNLEKIGLEKEVCDVFNKLYKLLKDIDAEMVEINPLALTDGGLVAVDSKIIVDDNALFRQPELSKIREEQLLGIEKDAFFKGIEYVELDGNVGVIGNGAGLVMSTLDTLKLQEMSPGNFLDVGGGASSEKMRNALEIVMEKNPKTILINIFGGITRCDEIAQGIVDYKKENRINIPIFVRLTGSKSNDAKKILEENDIGYFETLDKAMNSMVDKNVQ